MASWGVDCEFACFYCFLELAWAAGFGFVLGGSLIFCAVCRVSPRRATYFLVSQQESRQRSAPRCSRPFAARRATCFCEVIRRTAETPCASLRSNICRESVHEVCSGTCRCKPPDNLTESGVSRRGGERDGTSRCSCHQNGSCAPSREVARCKGTSEAMCRTPLFRLTHGGCLNGARSAERVPPWVFKARFG